MGYIYIRRKEHDNDRPENIKQDLFHYYHNTPILTPAHGKPRQGDTSICLLGVNIMCMVFLISGSFHMDNRLEMFCVFIVCIGVIIIANTLDYS